MTTKNELFSLINKRNKQELMFKSIIANYQAILKENMLLKQENICLKNQIKKSYECTGSYILDSIDVDNEYF